MGCVSVGGGAPGTVRGDVQGQAPFLSPLPGFHPLCEVAMKKGHPSPKAMAKMMAKHEGKMKPAIKKAYPKRKK